LRVVDLLGSTMGAGAGKEEGAVIGKKGRKGGRGPWPRCFFGRGASIRFEENGQEDRERGKGRGNN